MNVLNVDDSTTMRKIVTLALQSKGHTVSEASNGQEALDFISREGDPDLIVLDINMPVMTGMEFLDSYGGESAIIVLTTQYQDELRRQALLKGAKAFLTKPFQKEDLLSVMGEIGLK
jgi:two-component system chemotaxis response regulator CheY